MEISAALRMLRFRPVRRVLRGRLRRLHVAGRYQLPNAGRPGHTKAALEYANGKTSELTSSAPPMSPRTDFCGRFSRSRMAYLVSCYCTLNENMKLPRTIVGTICELGRVDALSSLGSNGPMVASAGQESWFNNVFGRDAIRMAFDMLPDAPDLARSTILELARLQGVNTDPHTEEEPGRILHEHRDRWSKETAPYGWEFPHYGAVDTTPQWINLLYAYCEKMGDELLSEAVPNLRGAPIRIEQSLCRAVDWLLSRLAGPIPGFVAAQRASPTGMINQGWMDSYDALFFEDGTLFDPDRPRVLIEVQGYAYDALVCAAFLLERRGAGADYLLRLRAAAQTLREKLLRELWLPDLETFAIAALADDDGQLRVTRVSGSNPGHLLASSVLDGSSLAKRRDQVVRRLLGPDMLAPGGVRTKSTLCIRFAAGAYHNGSTWPMDTGVLADGLRRHKYQTEASDLEERVLAACTRIGGFPEFLRGDNSPAIRVNDEFVESRDALGRVHLLEQPPQQTQGWTVTRVWRILRRRGFLDQEAALLAGPGEV